MFITLKNVCIHKYKCIESKQCFDFDEQVTVLVGMNESGKTSVLEALAKTHYFLDDESFRYNPTHDYPRKEKKKLDKSGDNPNAVTCTYSISEELRSSINEELGGAVFNAEEFERTVKYKNNASISGISIDTEHFWNSFFKKYKISDSSIKTSLKSISTHESLSETINSTEDEELVENLKSIEEFFPKTENWDNSIKYYVYKNWISPHIPKFLYYDEYYSLPSRISIEKLQSGHLESEELKTAKALFELADIDIDELINADDFEDFIAELEATEVSITEDLFEYWYTNQNLEIQFKIDKIEQIQQPNNNRIVEHVLDIRVRNNHTKMSLPLRNRSKGFNWFFSFLVWFKKIQEDKDSSYILLLDEPGLNLHAAAQADLLRFIEDLSDNYQIAYTTHSPFMVDPLYLHRVRTIVESKTGSKVSDSIQEKDPNTLFPLQAALGYDIAQNLFISKNNLLVEGVSDLIYLQVMDSILQENGNKGLNENITIVPTGGLDKVSTFVSLLRGSKLNIGCLLDSSIDKKNKSKLENLVHQKIIQGNKVKFFDEYVEDLDSADIEDLFDKDDYLKLFNAAFSEHNDIKKSDLKGENRQIIQQINENLGIDRFNHYRPANTLARMGASAKDFNKSTIEKFEAMFKSVNELFGK